MGKDVKDIGFTRREPARPKRKFASGTLEKSSPWITAARRPHYLSAEYHGHAGQPTKYLNTSAFHFYGPEAETKPGNLLPHLQLERQLPTLRCLYDPRISANRSTFRQPYVRLTSNMLNQARREKVDTEKSSAISLTDRAGKVSAKPTSTPRRLRLTIGL